VGSRKTSKGMVELLDAFALVAASRPGLHLRLIGGAPTAAEDAVLLARAEQLGIAARVRFEPAGSRAQVAAAMARAGLFVHPSPSESFGIVAVEALAAGLPIVAVAPTLIDRIGRDGRLGEAAAGSDARALGEAIERALDRLPEFDRGALRVATEAFGQESVASAIIDRYRAIGAVPAEHPPGGVLTADAGGTIGILVVAGRRRSALDRIGHLLPAAATALTVVTSAGADPLPADGGATWIELDPDAAWRAELARLGVSSDRAPRRSLPRQVLEVALHPIRTIARRRLYRRRTEMALAARAAATASAHDRLGRAVPVIALDADDVRVIEEAGLGAFLAPALLRWIADRQDAAGGPEIREWRVR
ncbi:MAG TPA: glycosyltransferase, partial [Candidatus Deferrimicrobium sp.]|nr:glycosyltransferase [Candidatus Deferrimicrobium sp.]